MKNIALLFSLFFLYLALMPCQDKEDASVSEVYTSVQKDQSAHNQKEQESCPPFCSCYCCSTVRHLASSVALPVYSKTVTRQYPDYAISSVKEQPIKIWQPPQIA
ncbi:MAG: DUF6660 family protein [Pedobacter sp.]|uniref:DUF6660 family protein n=1 Tax=Pedobacter sp. TaxID=1411316 RepID=UPI00339B94D6